MKPDLVEVKLVLWMSSALDFISKQNLDGGMSSWIKDEMVENKIS